MPNTIPAPILWAPTEEDYERSHLAAYQRWLAAEKGLIFTDYAACWQWSSSEPAAFWESIWEYFSPIHHAPYSEVLINGGMPHQVQWFVGSTLNYAENIFRHRNETRAALYFRNESTAYAVSWAELSTQVGRVQAFCGQKV
ncbi:MAG: hypothetical protein HC821_02770 [Lewinella sp.]|nr:hypothetical protein [Lewinella sp.]